MDVCLCGKFKTIVFFLVWTSIKETNSKFYIAYEGWTTIYSPNYPERYPNNVNKLYEIVTRDSNHVICFKASDFDVEYSPGCTKDYVTLQNSLTELPFGHWCGRSMSPTCSSAGIVFLGFHSDNNVTRYGYQIQFREESRESSQVPVMMIVGLSVVPLTILMILICFCFGRRKKRFTNTANMEAVSAIRSHPSHAPATPPADGQVSYISPDYGLPSYDSVVKSDQAELPPSYESLTMQDSNTKTH